MGAIESETGKGAITGDGDGDGVPGSFACMQQSLSQRQKDEGLRGGGGTSEDKEFGKSQLSVRLHVENLSSSCLAHKNGVKHRILPAKVRGGSTVGNEWFLKGFEDLEREGLRRAGLAGPRTQAKDKHIRE